MWNLCLPSVNDRNPNLRSMTVSFSLVEEERLIVGLPDVAQLGVHKKKVAEVSTWLKDFPHHRKVIFNRKYAAYSRNCLCCRDPLEQESRLRYRV
jgi:hypothetical protein